MSEEMLEMLSKFPVAKGKVALFLLIMLVMLGKRGRVIKVVTNIKLKKHKKKSICKTHSWLSNIQKFKTALLNDGKDPAADSIRIKQAKE